MYGEGNEPRLFVVVTWQEIQKHQYENSFQTRLKIALEKSFEEFSTGYFSGRSLMRNKHNAHNGKH